MLQNNNILIATKEISRFHYITQDLIEKSHAEQADQACKGGVKWIQFRSKSLKGDKLHEAAQTVKEIAIQYNAKLIINDYVNLALELDADGVHLGREDMYISEARKILGTSKIIGGTANNEVELQALLDTSVDYIGLGPFRFTTTKEKLSEVLTTSELQRLIQIQNSIPVILIGGIQITDIKTIANLSAYGLAVSSAINKSNRPSDTAAEFVRTIYQNFKNNE